jgi:hypothetical protein
VLRLSIDQVAERIAAYPEVCLRAAAMRASESDGEWIVRCADVVLGGEPPQWEEIEWVYPTARFEASTQSGRSVAEMLRSRTFVVVDAECATAEFPDVVQGERRQSWTEYGSSEPLDWPWDEWRISLVGQQPSQGATALISDTAPPFGTSDLALANLFGLTYRPNWNSPTQELVVRELDRRGRIQSVYVDPAYVEVSVEGSGLLLSRVSLAADTPGEIRVIGDAENPHLERFDTPDGTPPGAWIALVRDDRLVDRRTVDRTRLRAPEPGVQYAEPPADFDSDAPYTEEEQAAIHAAFERVRTALPARFPELTPSQLAEFDEELAAAEDELPHLKRRAWDRLMLGTIARAVGKDLITREASDLIITILKVALRALPAMHGLPELPTF